MEQLEPAAMHGEASTTVEPKVRPLGTEDIVRRQVDRVAYLRSSGLDWSEAVNELRDQLVGLEDAEFFDGIPERVRTHLVECESTKRWRRREWPDTVPPSCDHYKPSDLDVFLQRGWDTMEVRGETLSDGREALDPTPAELGAMRRCLGGLMARQGLTWRQKAHSIVPQEWGDDER